MKRKRVEKIQVCSFSKTTNFFFNIIITLLVISCILPFIFVIAISFTDESVLSAHRYSFRPEKSNIFGYTCLFDQIQGKIFQALFATVLVTALGTLISSTATSLYAYTISRSNFPLRRFFTAFCLIAMLFSPGTVANYPVMASPLQLKDTIQALILPMTVSPSNTIVMRTFSKCSVSDSIIESARIDGVSELRIFVQIVLPLAVPGIVTISLFAALGYWNDWFSALLYIQDGKPAPLQHLLMKIRSNIQYLTQNSGAGSQLTGGLVSVPRESVRMVIVVIPTLPITISYLFFQKHSVRSLTIGEIEE